MIGTKIPVHLECPIDTALYHLISPTVDKLHNWGWVPNSVTLCSVVFCVASLTSYYQGQPWSAACFWALSYMCDCADGMMARRYRQESALGDMLDHLSDIGGYLGFFLISARAVADGRSGWPLGLIVALASCAVMHLSCQELNSSAAPIAVLGGVRVCRQADNARFTRWGGVGTLNFAIIAAIFFYVS